MRLACLAASIMLVAQPAVSWSQVAEPVRASAAWVRATPPGATTGAFYLTLTSSRNDMLVGASSPAAEHASVHESRMEHGVMQMRPIEGGLALPAGKDVVLGPRGLHIMMDGLRSPLAAGMTVRMHLVFAHSRAIDVDAPVRPIGAGAAASTDMKGMDMGRP